MNFDKKNMNLETEDSEITEKQNYGEEELKNKSNEELDNISASNTESASQEETEGPQKKRRKVSRRRKILYGILAASLCLASFGAFLGLTKPGNQLLMRMGVNLGGKVWAVCTNDFAEVTAVPEKDVDYVEKEDIVSQSVEIDERKIVWPEHPGAGKQEEGVYNILLLGEEAIGAGDSRGRTDVMVIATLNTKTKKVKLTSLMRDMLVQIPGYNDNKLNSAYTKGGVDLLYEVIAQNFDIHIDGCIKVNFKNFEKLIDKLGGLEITLGEAEARYLNTTNYISNPAYRNVKVGAQHLNGNQVLGYCRVRKRSTITGNNNDYGRTDRHRIVLNAIFEKYKDCSKMEMASIMFSALPMVTTDISSENFELLMNSFIETGASDLEQLRIPADKTFQDNVKVRGMDVLIPNLEENINILHAFIYDEKTTEDSTKDSTTHNTTDTN